MNSPVSCIEFRSLYNAWLDERKSRPLLPEAVLHARSCSACGKYAKAMLQIDAGLHSIPDVPIPEEILSFSGKPGAHAPGRGGELSSLLRGGALLAFPALAIWIISLYLPLGWQFAAQFLLVSGSMVLFAVASLRPKLVA